MTDKRITMPVGFMAGSEIPLGLALHTLAAEMQGYAADLEELAARPSREDKNELLRYAASLRRYGWAVKIIALQNDPIEGQAFPALGSPELAEAAHRYSLRLPGES